MKQSLAKLGLLALLVGTLAACDGGSDGAPGATGATGSPGTPGKDAVATLKVSTLSADDWANLKPQVTVTGVSIAGAPVVSFSVKDDKGSPIVGLGNTSKASTATVASYPNLAFALAKLVPGSDGSPSKWVSYIVTTVPTTTAVATATRPSTDANGTLVDNGDGSYKYTFYRDVTKIKDQVAGFTLTAPNVAADLGDLSYDASKTHRMVVTVSGNAPGTGSNTANAVQLIPAVPMLKPAHGFYDWVPATGKTVTASDTQREIVQVSACFECHTKFTFHGGGRQDTKYCVVCHTDQRKFGRTEALVSGTQLTESSQNRLRGFSLFDLPNFVHKIHMGKELTLKGYSAGGVLLNEVTYPQPITNCVKCHSASTATPQGDNWKNVPSRLACGACHDGINFATGQGKTIAGDSIGHIGGAKADDKLCSTCHSADDIQKIYHVTVDPTGSSTRAGYPVNTAQDVPTPGYASGQGPAIPLASQLGNLPAGVYKINFEIKQVTLAGAAGAKKATVIYRILKDGQPVTVNPTGYLINGVDGSPDVVIAYGLGQDGITNPVDWTTTVTAKIIDIRDKKSGHSQTGPDASGYYTATLGTVIPDAAKMVTGVVGIDYQGFVQLNLPAYPKGIRIREPLFVMKLADGQTARRAIVSAAKCNSCHGQLGVSPSFHGGRSNNGEGCALCHTPNNSTGHTGAANNYGGGWSVSAKNLIHGIHGGSKREQAYTYEATAENPLGFKEVTYPSVLRNCEQCHLPGSYDFSNTANAAAVPNLLWTTEAKTDMSNPSNVPSLGLSPWITILGRGQASYTTDPLVSSPIASACFGCHDSRPALAHMQGNGGSIYASAASVGGNAARTNAFNKPEQCLLCHGTGKLADIKAVHMKF